MAQENLKLISVRLNPDTLKMIDDFANRHNYWTRNSVINNVLSSVFNDFTDGAIYDMARRSVFQREQVTARYEIVQVKPPYM